MPARPGNGPEDQQPWTARWCWTTTAPRARPWNSYAFFRRTVDLPDRPTHAIVRITADARYALFVNGRPVHQGPARSFPGQQSFDTLDLADFLTAGLNAICAIVHQFGVPTGQSVYRDATGFLLDGVVESNAGALPIHTPDDWLARDAAGWRKNVARISPQLGFQEHVDADADPPDWLVPEFSATEENGWKSATAVAPATGHPWLNLTPRNVPLLAYHNELFASVLAHFTGEDARGHKIAEDVYHHPLQEARKKAKDPFENPGTLLRDDDEASTLPPPPDGHFHMIVLDAGNYHAGYLCLDIAEAAGDEIVDVLYLQDLDKTSGPAITSASENAPADRYRCRPGHQRWESFWPRGFRHIALIFRNVEKPLKIRHVSIRAVGAALEPIGRFECSDEVLNRVYNAAAQTLRASTLDAFVDCPGLSQRQRWDHASIQARGTAWLFGDTSILERGIGLVAQSQAEDGSLHSHPPSDDPTGRRIDAMLAWVGSLWEHHYHTSRVDQLISYRPTLDRLLEFCARHEKLDGMLGDLTGFEPAFDPPELYRGDFSAPVNLLYLQALRQAAAIYELLKLEKDSALALRKADVLARAIETRFWDAKAKSWKDTFDPAAKQPSDQTSLHTAALAVLLDLRPETRAAAGKELAKAMAGRRGKALTPSPPFAAHLLDALANADLRAEALELIKSRWGAMLDRSGTTLWERWDGSAGSRCCGAATAPLYVLPQQVLGVTQAEAGWKRVRIAPLVGALEFARGVVPSPLGPIRVEWEKVGEDQLAVRVELPEGMEAEFCGPLGEKRALEGGATEFHT
jgi:hypothetical protein